VVVAVLACKTTQAPSSSSTTPEPVATTRTAPPEPSGPKPTIEPAHPWPLVLLDVRGHEPLPDAPQPSLWLTREGIGATSATGAIERVSLLADGRVDPGDSTLVLPEIYATLAAHERARTLTVWVDERIPGDTVLRALLTSARAGYREWAFVVGKPGARELLRVTAPRLAPPVTLVADPVWADLELSWTSGGVLATLVARELDTIETRQSLTTPLDLSGGSCTVPGGDRPDSTVVDQTLAVLCAAAKGNRFAVRVRLGGAERIDDVLQVLAYDRRPEPCRLPPIVELVADTKPRTCDGALTHANALAAFELDKRTRASPVASSGQLAAKHRDTPAQPQGRVQTVAPTVTGPLQPTIIRRIVRVRLAELRDCYHEALDATPDLAGRIEIAFAIDGDGKVTRATVASSTIPDKQVGYCMAEAFARWKFPAAQGGQKVEVVYPLELSPG
jgi:hypothetical protein